MKKTLISKWGCAILEILAILFFEAVDDDTGVGDADAKADVEVGDYEGGAVAARIADMSIEVGDGGAGANHSVDVNPGGASRDWLLAAAFAALRMAYPPRGSKKPSPKSPPPMILSLKALPASTPS